MILGIYVRREMSQKIYKVFNNICAGIQDVIPRPTFEEILQLKKKIYFFFELLPNRY